MTEELQQAVLQQLAAAGDPANIAGMARFGIITKKAFGVATPAVKEIAKNVKKIAVNRHELALALWETEYHEARAVAYLIEDPRKVTSAQMEKWASDFDNWAVCDGTCGHLFCRTKYAYEKAYMWCERDEEFVKRAGIVLMAWLAVHDKKADDEVIAEFLPVLETLVDDDRNFIRKAVNWSLRQIGKRSLWLNSEAILTAERIRKRDTRAARWIAADALRELSNEKVKERLIARARKRSQG